MRSLVLTCTLLLAACTGPSPQDYAGFKPALVPSEFFLGDLRAHGVIKNRGGKVVRYFSADIEASWVDGVGTLDEDFVFNDGVTERRVWTLTPTGTGGYGASAGDVVGTGKLEYQGNSIFLDYVLSVPYGDGTIDVSVDDRMYLVAPDVLINESILRKFGFEVGSILLVIQRIGDDG
jgi:hypothetical protein